jgi:tetratricopeptide (TPR) repeat protein
MSLLMKALKKAEESQQGVLGGREPTLQELAAELSLEPHVPETAPGAASAKKAAFDTQNVSGNGAAQQAANLFAAKESQGDGSKRLLAVLSAVALLLLAGGGAYVYIAINKPGLLVSAPPASSPSSAPVAVNAPLLPVENQMPPPGVEVSPAAIMDEEPKPPRSAVEPAPYTAAVAKNREMSAVEAAPESKVKVSHGAQTEINPDLAQGYQALQEGRLEAAQSAYQRLLQQEPRNMDGLLGMAAVAVRSNNPGEAGRLYLRAIDVEPKNSFAQAGLLNLLGSADPAGSEAKLKRLLADQPSAFLYFALGNLYAAGERWSDAQQAYFQAHHLASANPDYAFNLAVSLEHINQPKPALSYYQRAVQLLGRDGAAAFDRAAVEARIVKLKRMTE